MKGARLTFWKNFPGLIVFHALIWWICFFSAELILQSHLNIFISFLIFNLVLNF